MYVCTGRRVVFLRCDCYVLVPLLLHWGTEVLLHNELLFIYFYLNEGVTTLVACLSPSLRDAIQIMGDLAVQYGFYGSEWDSTDPMTYMEVGYSY